MIHDPVVEVTCDNCDDACVQVEPDYVYTDYSGERGYFDTSDAAIAKLLPRYEWLERNGKHYCEDCTEGNEE